MAYLLHMAHNHLVIIYLAQLPLSITYFGPKKMFSNLLQTFRKIKFIMHPPQGPKGRGVALIGAMQGVLLVVGVIATV